jgi:exodeoxyribonuclease VIII
MKNHLHILLDIEALGRRTGSAVIQLGAVAFSLETGLTGEAFHRHIHPGDRLTIDNVSLQWHAEHGTWPPADMTLPIVELKDALADFITWCSDLGEPVSFWSWGSTYDFPLLEAAHQAAGEEIPWEYWQASCARTVWRLAFPDTKHDPRPHHALEDAKAAALDLVKALAIVRETLSPFAA